LLLSGVDAQTTIRVNINFGEGMIYFLVILFFALNFGTPIGNWLYANIFSKWVDKTVKEVTKATMRFAERISDANRRTAQSIRPEK
jgi:uncharacterized membrane protein YoaT (DUF817 family)